MNGSKPEVKNQRSFKCVEVIIDEMTSRDSQVKITLSKWDAKRDVNIRVTRRFRKLTFYLN